MMGIRKYNKIITGLGIVCLLVFLFAFNPPKKDVNENVPIFLRPDTRWADSVFNTLTPDERIAQLFMVAAYSNKGLDHFVDIVKLVSEYKIGGLIFFQGGPVRQAILTNRYQAMSKTPLLISIDGEWGLAMRLDSTQQYPRQMSLGAIQNDTLIYQMGKEIARQCKRMGIHVNLAPVADVNNNPLNPVIGNRSFGENKYLVARKALSYMRGMQDAGVMANAKHFPGHGDTDSDSHKTLPIITHSKERMDTLELYPFKQLIKQGLGSMMVAHLFIPAYDSTPNNASTLSKAVVTDLLKDKLQFNGLIFTDALNMKGVSKFHQPGVLDVKALLAGNDVLLFSEDVPLAMEQVKRAIEMGKITQEEIDVRCKKILYAKQWCGLNRYRPIDLNNLVQDLNNPEAIMINRKLVEASLTLLVNKNDLLPLKRLDTLRLASLSLGYAPMNDFQRTLDKYATVTHFGIDRDATQAQCDTMINKLLLFNLAIVQLNNVNNNPKKNFGLTQAEIYMIKTLKEKMKVVLNITANPYILSKLEGVERVHALIASYEDTPLTQELSAQLIFGGIKASGKLPVSPSDVFKFGNGITSINPIRFKYTLPEDIGMSSIAFLKIDSMARKGVEDHVYPGCQILVAKDGNVIYQKSFGFHTYENNRTVSNDDLYDLASITKIASSTAALMTLLDKKKVSLDEYLCYYLPELENTNKQDIVLREMLTHQAGLKDWIPFWQRTVKSGNYKEGIYNKTRNDFFSVRVAEDLYLNKNYTDTLYNFIINSSLSKDKTYKYSDLGYYFLQHIIEKQTGDSLHNYVQKTFYNSLGATTMGYHPRERFSLRKIVPTEYDVHFRKQLVHGDVHDPGAAMLGGVGGHAGLFSNANDLAKMMQMFMQKGEYGGMRYIDSATVGECTKCQYCVDNRRGIGFDKPETNPEKDSPVCECVSYLSFGHSGFTGTLAWADPQYNLVYIFLSNRVYPDAGAENKLSKSGIRSAIQKVIYDEVLKSK